MLTKSMILADMISNTCFSLERAVIDGAAYVFLTPAPGYAMLWNGFLVKRIAWDKTSHTFTLYHFGLTCGHAEFDIFETVDLVIRGPEWMAAKLAEG